jgi:hypothetical protein
MLPYQFIIPIDRTVEVDERQMLRNILILKLIRIYRIVRNKQDSTTIKRMIGFIYEPESREGQISLDRKIKNYIKLVN